VGCLQPTSRRGDIKPCSLAARGGALQAAHPTVIAVRSRGRQWPQNKAPTLNRVCNTIEKMREQCLSSQVDPKAFQKVGFSSTGALIAKGRSGELIVERRPF
jgi:hypothetical protein